MTPTRQFAKGQTRQLSFRCLMGACAWAVSLPLAAGEPVDFARDIQPILATNCYQCHGPDKQETGLRLDIGSTLLQGGNSGPAIVAGKASDSLLIQAVSGVADVSKMPPKGPPLQPAQIELLKEWIDRGAKLPDGSAAQGPRRKSNHWSFQPLAHPKPPPVNNLAWVRNPIDAFILARLESASLEPSGEAERATLLRRVSLDLLGLPPTIQQIEEFLSDNSGDAYERMVDRLLGSPHYGERWGRHWLDVARYADSNGYTIDGGRSIWKYRDWVIGALNRDLPFDQFTIEQLAGDMLPEARMDQIIATGFHRNTLTNEEGGTDPEQFRVEAVVDRVSTTGAAFLGLTLGCARCHDHKYDPISQREFYQLFALFNNADEPAFPVPTDQQSKELPPLLAEIEQSEKRLAEVDANSGGRQAEWEGKFSGRLAVDWTVLDIDAQSAAGVSFSKLDDRSLLAGGNTPANDVYTVTAAAANHPITAIRLEVLTHDSLPKKGPGLADNGNFVLSEFSISAADSPSSPNSDPLALTGAWADYSGDNGAVENAIDGKPATGWNIAAAKDLNTPRTAIFFLRDDLNAPAGGKLTFVLEQKYDKPRYQIGRFRVSVTKADRDVLKLPAAIRDALAIAPDSRTAEQKQALKLEYQKIDPERLPLARQIAELRQRQKQIAAATTTTMVVRERSEPRETHIHIRGDFLHPGAPVRPDVPQVLPSISARTARADRLDFARWLVDSSNPLTPRVTVNRLWQTYFGQGLVATENDFGLQGDRPLHPELLDGLAGQFIESGWSVKAMHRLIVTSATYRQSSRMRSDLAAADPYNKLLGRQQRLRLEAETIRDAALAASGLLSREIGGPGVYPPQPEGIYRFTQQVKFWGENKNADRYRRGMYTYFWRSSPYPFLKTFDAPDANVACTRRARSNTPLQALTLANDRAFFEIAQGFASQLLAGSWVTDSERIQSAFRRCLARDPSPNELAGLTEFLASQRKRFETSPQDAASVAPANRPSQVDPVQAATWTTLARVLLNLDEFITRE
ncbi:MAG: PSD1 domain-containing protein [Planctomycetia bacterium]|nr:PSD1 domain-containing protein [Planctomycetia bacterium]